jgi:hypothetical protein
MAVMLCGILWPKCLYLDILTLGDSKKLAAIDHPDSICKPGVWSKVQRVRGLVLGHPERP